MHIVTFYSYKGGVGRTMALVNVACLMAKEGKRVLVVDFDLEAPGLASYLPNAQLADVGGVVDFVRKYAQTGISPDVRAFIAPVEVEDKTLWFMPAGRHTEVAYSKELGEIDWATLYEEKEGFLLMEDLKAQWANYQGNGFDYVLIDSRTGHSDVGGICTRQLPDAVVVMFVPTPQNVSGLAPIAKAIAQEFSPVRADKIKMHFCPSNVPDLDDEEEILKELLGSAKEALAYKKNASVINHYRSLDLLEHKIYAIRKPNSRLHQTIREAKVGYCCWQFGR